MRRATAVCVCVLLTSWASRARAQAPLPPDPAEATARIQAGALLLNPRFELLNTGIDTNVFNEAEDPKRDFTATFRPSLDATLRANLFRFVYRASVDAIYFHEYEAERSFNRSGEVRTELRLARAVPYFTIGGLATSERPNNEVDLRASRSVNTYTGGAALLLFSRTAAVVRVERQNLSYDDSQTFAGEDLAVQFNNRKTSIDAGARIALTELTTMSVTGGRDEIRFVFSPERDADSTRAGVAFEFDPLAIISGSASISYRRFSPLSDTLEPFRGLVSQATIRYAWQDQTVVAVRFLRDVDYSIEEGQPYYLLNAALLTVTQHLGGPYDLQGSVGRESRGYRGRATAAAGDPSSDTIDTVTAGVGYRLGEVGRVGLNVEFTSRDALHSGRSYDRRRIFTSFSYGF